eukprot:Tamp_25764.p1 GENE.Tamp_25764~~Tamp_25764.p1  ORF type:complete len:155 (+),score=19.17 Tamp_25764:313-777(+)
MMAQDDEFAQPSAQEVEKAAEAFHETKPCEDARQDQGLEDTPLAASISARMLGAGDDEDQDEEGGSQSPSQVTPAFNLPAYSPSAQPATEAVQDNWDDEPLAPLPGYVARPSNSSWSLRSRIAARHSTSWRWISCLLQRMTTWSTARRLARASK